MDIPSLQMDSVEFPNEIRNDYPDVVEFLANEWLRREFVQLGFKASVKPPYMIASRSDKRCFTISTETSFTSRVASRLLSRKDYARQLFNQAGLSVPEGYRFRNKDKNRAFRCVKKLGEAVIKPVNSQMGKGVSVGVTPEYFENAWLAATAETTRGVLIERRILGTEARYLVVDGQCVAVCKCIPPMVYGDGQSTVGQLVDRQNVLRSRNPVLVPSPILIDTHRENILRTQGFDLNSVPPDRRRVILDIKASIATGGEPQDITDQVHRTMKAVAEEVAVILAGLDVLGVDIIAENHSEPARQGGYAIIEANTRPDIGIHHFPVYGSPINVSRYIAESCARRLGFDVSRGAAVTESQPLRSEPTVTQIDDGIVGDTSRRAAMETVDHDDAITTAIEVTNLSVTDMVQQPETILQNRKIGKTQSRVKNIRLTPRLSSHLLPPGASEKDALNRSWRNK